VTLVHSSAIKATMQIDPCTETVHFTFDLSKSLRSMTVIATVTSKQHTTEVTMVLKYFRKGLYKE